MNLGNVFELFLLMLFIGPGAYIGNALGGLLGAVIGGVTGLLVRIGLGLVANRLQAASCHCGAREWDDFEISERASSEFEFACRRCGRVYELRRRLWSERLSDGTVVPRMRRVALVFWRAV